MIKQKNTFVFYMLPLGLLLILSGVHFVFFHGGYLGYDELEYARLASLWSDGRFEHDSLYAYRYAGFLPLAFLYKIFEPGDFSNALFSVLFLAGILILVLRWQKPLSYLTTIVIVLSLVCAPLHLLYLEKPMPDIVTEFGFLLCFYVYYKINFDHSPNRLWIHVLLFMIGFLCIFFSKETFLIIYPFFLFFFLRDIFRRKQLTFWVLTAISIFLFGMVYLLLNKVFLGNSMARIDAIFTNRYISECTYELQPFSVVLERILYKLWVEMSRSGFLWPLGFVLVLWVRKNTEPKYKFLAASWVMLMLLANFMTISYTDYVPLCHDPRHFLYILPLGAVIIAKGWEGIPNYTFTEKIVLTLVWSLQLGIGLYFSHENTWFLFLPFIGAVWMPSFKGSSLVTTSLFIVGVLSVYIQNANYNLTINHNGQKKLIEAVLKRDDEPKWILTDGANTNIGSFYAQYNDKNQFVVFKDYDPKVHLGRDVYIILNGMTAYLSNTDWDKVPEFVKSAEKNIPVLYKNEAGVVYRIPKQ